MYRLRGWCKLTSKCVGGCMPQCVRVVARSLADLITHEEPWFFFLLSIQSILISPLISLCLLSNGRFIKSWEKSIFLAPKLKHFQFSSVRAAWVLSCLFSFASLSIGFICKCTASKNCPAHPIPPQIIKSSQDIPFFIEGIYLRPCKATGSRRWHKSHGRRVPQPAICMAALTEWIIVLGQTSGILRGNQEICM